MAFIIGTAGHIDHRKTTLVRCLTGQDTDRLPAEKARGMSIDLGFARLEIAGMPQIGVVDVPGHDRFIRNMVAGVHGLDLVLIVVAADDGVMPQTREHFDILRALGLTQAIFVITKADLVGPARLIEVRREIADLAAGSTFRHAPVQPVSGLDGAGIAALRDLIARALLALPPRKSGGHFRMPIDQVLSITGRGLVITGTVLSGTITPRDDIVVVPGGSRYRMRGMQSHGAPVTQGRAGMRLALNLIGADRAALHRGDVACDGAIARTTTRFDAEIRLSAHGARNLKTGTRLRLHLGTAERLVAVLLLGADTQLVPGAASHVQILADAPLHAMSGDRFILRDAPGQITLANGVVLDPLGEKARRGDAGRLARLTCLSAGDSGAAAVLLLNDLPGFGIKADDLAFRLGLEPDTLAGLIAGRSHLHQIVDGGESWITTTRALDGFEARLMSALRLEHGRNPHSTGLPAEALRARVGGAVDPRLFRKLIDRALAAGTLQQSDGMLALASHRPGLSPAQNAEAAGFLDALTAAPFGPPPPDLSDAKTILAHLEKVGKIRRTSSGVIFAATAMHRADQLLETHLQTQGSISAAEFRDLLGTTRKFALALLESFDRTGRTIRTGDRRKRGKPPSDPAA